MNRIFIKRTSAISIVGLLSTCGLLAQTTPPELTLLDAEKLALKNHPQVLASQALTQRADQMTIQARSA